MKTRKILAASTAALLAFGTTAAYVASAAATVVDIDADGEWNAVGTTKVSYKAAKADKKVFEDLKFSVEVVNASSNITPAADADTPAANKDSGGLGTIDGMKKLKAKTLTGIAQKLSVWNKDLATPAAEANAAIYQLKVVPAGDDEYVERNDFVLKAKLGVAIEDLSFAADHVYHVEGSQLVEIEYDRLTKKDNKYGIEFTTKSFSPFIVSKGAIKGAVALDDDENPANTSGTSSAATSTATSNGGTTTNPDTGIALAIAPVVLAAGAVAVVALKKKH